MLLTKNIKILINKEKLCEINYLNLENRHFSITELLSMSEFILLFYCPVKRKIPLALSLYYLCQCYPESRILSHCPKAEKCPLRSTQRFIIYSEVEFYNVNLLTQFYNPKRF